MDKIHKVRGREGLVKDPSTNTVINSKESEYDNYRRNVKKLREAVVREQEQERKFNDLNARIAKLEELLSKGSSDE